jgi:DNA adenine methylase
MKLESHATFKELKVKPFLRWAGGKSWFVKKIDEFLPISINNYFEPFLGGASIFIHLKSKGLIQGDSYLSDSNNNLVNAYNVLSSDPRALIKKLSSYENTKEYYYKIRDSKFNSPIEKAAQFIFLNRTSFNGIYRENLKGEYNVPYGNKKYKELFNELNLLKVSKLLKETTISSFDFMDIKPLIKKGDFIFLDPPYTVAHKHNGFVKYNQKIFSWEDQIKLKEFVVYLIKIEVNFILTNASHDSIDSLYKGIGKHYYLNRPSVIGGKNAKRDMYEEIIITNL